MEQRTCQRCNAPLTGSRSKWCSDACRSAYDYQVHIDERRRKNRERAAANRKSVVHPPRACIICGEDFTPARSNTLTCSKRCKIARDTRVRRTKNYRDPTGLETCDLCCERYRPPGVSGKYCSADCFRRIERAKRYKNSTPRPRITKFTCGDCGVTCEPGKAGVDPKASRFCSKACKRRWHMRHGKPRKPSARGPRRPRRQVVAAAALRAAARGTKGGGRWAGHTCSECGVKFLGRLNSSDRRAVNVYCGRRCKNRYFNRIRRAQLRNVGTGDPVRFHEIAERDRWCCQLCNKPVDRDTSVPHPKAPVLDHIIPLAKRGTHEPSNVQLAHFMCNSIKSDGTYGVAGEQLRLVA